MRKNCLLALGLFFMVWGIIALSINSANAYDFRLQNATIAALVEHGRFTLHELEVPDFRLIVGQETFRIGESVYPMKQPGQTIVGALVYYPLYTLGLTFQVHYLFVSQLITLYSSAFLTSAACLFMVFLGWKLSRRVSIGIVSGLLFVFGTIVWPYAGVTHHDIYGLFLIVLSLFGYFSGHPMAEGFFAGLSLFFTMLPLPIPLALWFLSPKKVRMGLGMFLGILPTIVFNVFVFGKPWLASNLAGKVTDTLPLLSLSNFAEKIWFYLGNPQTALWAFSPILLFGFLGIIRAKKTEWPHLTRFLLIPPLAQLVYVSSIETFGGYQYGPRYVIPVIPFLILGVSIWLKSPQTLGKKILFALACIYSIAVGVIGAVGGVMHAVTPGYEPFLLAQQLMTDGLPVARVWKYGVALILVGVLVFALGRIDIRWRGRQKEK